MKTIATLIDDIHEVIEGGNGWTEEFAKFFSETIGKQSLVAFSEPNAPRDWVGLSAVGKPCDLEKWYIVNESHKADKMPPELLGTFFYGHMLEAFVLSLAMAAGHRVEGLQEPLNVFGVPGSGDAIIDGHVVDVKSSGTRAMEKFTYHQLKGYHNKKDEWIPARDVDGFGYISQLSSYLYGYKDDPRVHDKENASFFVVGKERFKLQLDTYNLKDELENKQKEIEHTKAVTTGPRPPRGFSDVEDGKSGNRKLGFQCSYCDFRKDCWPDTRTFWYSNGPRHLTNVTRPPQEHIKET